MSVSPTTKLPRSRIDRLSVASTPRTERCTSKPAVPCSIRPGSNTIFAALHEHLSEVEIFGFTYVTSSNAIHTTMSRSLRLKYDDVNNRLVGGVDPIVALPD